MSLFETAFDVEFGACDPAGIVFYPRYFEWFDATFQRWLRAHGTDQADLRTRFAAIGTGLLGSEAKFRAPMRPGDRLVLAIEHLDWSDRTLSVRYIGRCGEHPVVEGLETRGLFGADADGTLRLMDLEPIRAMLAP